MSAVTPPVVLFLIGAPRSGTTMLERMLSAHPAILGGPEPHLLTPLAHLGPWSQVDKAPYDHIVAAIGQKDFIGRLPAGEQDYWAACRAYCDHLYAKALEGSGRTVCLDKTPEYATVLPFLAKVYPDARYVVLTRHPVAVFTSFANSFFDGDFHIAQSHDPLLDRYVPALARFLRQSAVAHLHVRYEDLVAAPADSMARILKHVGLPYDPAVLDYARHAGGVQGLGDPLGVGRHQGPSRESLDKWADELVVNPGKLTFVENLVKRLDPHDLETLGYPLGTFWAPLNGRGRSARPTRLNRYLVQRKLIVRGRAWVQRSNMMRKALQRVRLMCDVLLREY